MSKSKGNVVNPTGIIDQGYGADAVRMSIAFLAPYDQTTPWNSEGVAGTHRFLNRVWTLVHEFNESKQGEKSNQELLKASNKCIKKVSEDLHQMAFNTAIAALMSFVNELYKIKAEDKFESKEWNNCITVLLQLLAPFAPHLTEELWAEMGVNDSVHISKWPVHDDNLLIEKNVGIVIQVNGKVRGNVIVPNDSNKDTIVIAAKKDEKIQKYLVSEPKKTIFVKNRLINFVV